MGGRPPDLGAETRTRGPDLTLPAIVVQLLLRHRSRGIVHRPIGLSRIGKVDHEDTSLLEPEIGFHLGVLAPHARGRPQVVGYGRPAPEVAARDPAEARVPPPPPRHWTWAALMRRAFAIDVLVCPRCGERLRVIATVEDLVAVRRILAARPTAPAGPGPPAGALAMAS